MSKNIPTLAKKNCFRLSSNRKIFLSAQLRVKHISSCSKHWRKTRRAETARNPVLWTLRFAPCWLYLTNHLSGNTEMFKATSFWSASSTSKEQILKYISSLTRTVLVQRKQYCTWPWWIQTVFERTKRFVSDFNELWHRVKRFMTAFANQALHIGAS